jgi:hypothetical protein
MLANGWVISHESLGAKFKASSAENFPFLLAATKAVWSCMPTGRRPSQWLCDFIWITRRDASQNNNEIMRAKVARRFIPARPACLSSARNWRRNGLSLQ